MILPNFTLRLEPELRDLVKSCVRFARQPGGRERLEELIAGGVSGQLGGVAGIREDLASLAERVAALEDASKAIASQVLHQEKTSKAIVTQPVLPPVEANADEANVPAQSFGEKLKAARVKAELSQGQLATKSGVGQPTISELERDKKTPDPATMAKLAEVLNAPELAEVNQ